MQQAQCTLAWLAKFQFKHGREKKNHLLTSMIFQPTKNNNNILVTGKPYQVYEICPYSTSNDIHIKFSQIAWFLLTSFDLWPQPKLKKILEIYDFSYFSLCWPPMVFDLLPQPPSPYPTKHNCNLVLIIGKPQVNITSVKKTISRASHMHTHTHAHMWNWQHRLLACVWQTNHMSNDTYLS